MVDWDAFSFPEFSVWNFSNFKVGDVNWMLTETKLFMRSVQELRKGRTEEQASYWRESERDY